MNKPSSILTGLALSATLLLGGCGSLAGAADVDSNAATSAASLVAPVVELSYADLEIADVNVTPDLADAVDLTLADGASRGGAGVSVEEDTVTIEAAGTYQISGSLSSGSLVVDAPGEVVRLVLDGVDITAAGVAAINVVAAEQVVVWLTDGAENFLSDSADASVDELDDVDGAAGTAGAAEDAPNATLFATSDLWIAGDGSLAVTSNAADAITSKDTLVMVSGDVSVEAADDGVRGKDHLVIVGGSLTADVEGDALRSDNEASASDSDATVGVIWIDGGSLDLTAGSDAVDAARQVTVLSGSLSIAAGDDGLHSDNVLRIDGGDIRITESVEGIEGAYMYLSGGDVSVVSSDDGINVSGGVEGLAEANDDATADAGVGAAPGMGEGPRDGGPPAGGQMPGAGGGPDVGAGTSDPVDEATSLTVSAMEGSGFGGPAEAGNGTRFLEVSGGTYLVDTTSDGVDVNGSMLMTGGSLVVSGTVDARNGALDVDDEFTISGGTLAASGMATMAVAPGESSTQATLALTFSGILPAGTLITVSSSDGTQLASFTTPKASESFIYSSDALESGSDYSISVGGKVSGSTAGWLVPGGQASGGEVIGTVLAN